jgi:hypothetical protein
MPGVVGELVGVSVGPGVGDSPPLPRPGGLVIVTGGVVGTTTGVVGITTGGVVGTETGIDGTTTTGGVGPGVGDSPPLP